MKKVIAIFLLTLYVTVALGTVITHHICRDATTRITAGKTAHKQGESCPSKKSSKDCCTVVLQYSCADRHKAAPPEPEPASGTGPLKSAYQAERGVPIPFFLFNTALRI